MNTHRFNAITLCLGLLLLTGCGSDGDGGGTTADELPDLHFDILQLGASSTVEQDQWYAVTRLYYNRNGCGDEEKLILAPGKADGDADAFVVAYYFSTDQTLDASDILMSPEEEVPGMEGCSSTDWEDYLLWIPADFTVGTYYCIAVLDDDDEVEEDDEDNNTLSTSSFDIVTPAGGKPNLGGSGSSHTSVVTQGNSSSVSVTVVNRGAVTCETPCVGRLYISDDWNINAGDTLVSEDIPLSALCSGQQQKVEIDFEVPDTHSGETLILFVIDADDEIDEGTAENDNIYGMWVTINP